MKQVLFSLLLIVIISSVWFAYRGEQQNQALSKELESLKKYTSSLESDILRLEQEALERKLEHKENAGENTTDDIGNSQSDASLETLVEDAGTVLKESLDSAIKGVQSELDRVKEKLNEEMNKLRLDDSTAEPQHDNDVTGTKTHST